MTVIDPGEMMSAAKIQLLRDHPFWATILLSLPVVETTSVPIMGTDGYNLYWNAEGGRKTVPSLQHPGRGL